MISVSWIAIFAQDPEVGCGGCVKWEEDFILIFFLCIKDHETQALFLHTGLDKGNLYILNQ